MFQSKLPGTVAHKHYMRGFFHHQTGNGYGVCDVFNGRNGAAITELVHNAGIQCHIAITIGVTGPAYRMIFHVSFGNFYTGFNGIQCAAAFSKNGPGFFIGRYTKVPG